jgi:hypothetical protein
MPVGTRATSGLIAPLRSALDGVRARHGDPPVHGVTPSIVVTDRTGWTRAADLDVDDLLAAARSRWPGGPHVAAALAFKSYAYWTTLPAVIGYAGARRVPALTAHNTLVRIHHVAPFVEIGLARAEATVLVGDPDAGNPDATVVAGDAALLAAMRAQLLDGHLVPLVDELHDRLRLGRRTLLGSVASAVCYALLRAGDVLPGSASRTAATVLAALGLTDLATLAPDASGVLRVQRYTCCLAFAADTPRICSGCVLPRG